MRIAIIGSGIAGLTAAYKLHRRHEITLFESADYIGGHTATVSVEEDGRIIPVDTGFIVYNDWTYPNFCRLLDALGVATQPSNMSFSVRDEAGDLEYSGDNLNTLFAQRRNLLRPGFYRLLMDIFRFYRQSRVLLQSPDFTLTLGDYLRDNRYSTEFVEKHLIPMGAAIWSADPQQFCRFPAAYFVRFCHNHGMLNVFRRPQWRVIAGGSQQYVKAMTAGFSDRVRLRTPVRWIRRLATHVEVATDDAIERFDAVVPALHSDQALALLADPSAAERSILGVMKYQRNDVLLHTDTRMLPRRRRAWASWNYHIPARSTGLATMTYNMNKLQSLHTRETYCVTLNSSTQIDERKVIRAFVYHHPVYGVESVAAQARHGEISGVNRTFYCGAYWGYGFHEDGVVSGLRVCEQIEAFEAARPSESAGGERQARSLAGVA